MHVLLVQGRFLISPMAPIRSTCANDLLMVACVRPMGFTGEIVVPMPMPLRVRGSRCAHEPAEAFSGNGDLHVVASCGAVHVRS